MTPAAEQIIPSSILTGSPSPDEGPFDFMTEEEFQAVILRTMEGELVRREDALRFSERHWSRLRDVVFLSRLRHAEKVFKSGKARGRTGAILCLSALQMIVEAVVPEAKGKLGLIAKIGAALHELDAGELPELFRPGVSAEDRRRHLGLVKGD